MKKLNYVQALNEAFKEEMRRDASIIVLGMNVSESGTFGETEGLSAEFGDDRVIDTPYSQGSIEGVALGLSMTGAKPVVMISGEYLLKAADTIANQIAVTDYMYTSQFATSMVMIADIGFRGELGPQLCQSSEAVFCQIPGLFVVCPSTAADLKAVFKTAVNTPAPVLLLLDKALFDVEFEVPDFTNKREFRSADVKREGSNVTILTYGSMTHKCLAAAERASAESNIECEVIDLISLSPIDMSAIVASVNKTGRVIIVHEARRNCGLGAELAASIIESEAFFYLESPIVRLCAKDLPIPYGKTDFEAIVPSTEDILAAVNRAMA